MAWGRGSKGHYGRINVGEVGDRRGAGLSRRSEVRSCRDGDTIRGVLSVVHRVFRGPAR